MATLPNPLPRLAADPSGRSLGLRLPLGRLTDATDEGPWHEPLLWYAEQSASSGNWTALGAPAARVGLLPVLIDVGGTQGGPEDWELMPGEMSYPGDHAAEEVLAEYWNDIAEDEFYDDEDKRESAVEAPRRTDEDESPLAPFGPDWPGLAPTATRLVVDPDTRAVQIADSLAEGARSWFKEPRLALVPARRSADIPAAIGWTGPLNHENDVARICAVLRSWEDRFGIRVVALGFDTLVVSVAAPPTTLEEAEALAAEHFAFCPDTILQNGTETLRGYAQDLIGEDTWSFWWD